MKKGTVGLVIMTFAWLLVLGLPGEGAAQYLGETTWILTKTQNKHGAVIPPQTFTLKGAITRMGGSYYTMQGFVAVSQDGPFIVAGGGVLIGSTLYITLSTSQKHVDSNRDTSIMHIELDKASLNGSLFTVGREFDTATAGPAPIFDDSFAAGSLTRSGPPINLTPGVPLSLLLLEPKP